MRYLAFLRGVMPSGKNSIPKMSQLVELLEQAGLKQVSTYIQSGNIICQTDLASSDLAQLIHETILAGLGADLQVIVKRAEDLQAILSDNPFDDSHDWSRIHVLLADDLPSEHDLATLEAMDFGLEKWVRGKSCIYLYLPREAKPKRLTTNFFEKKFALPMTMRKINVIRALSQKV